VASTSTAFHRLADSWSEEELMGAISEDLSQRLPYVAYPAEMHAEGTSTLDAVNGSEDEARYYGPETTGQQERDYLDEMELPGFPEQEAERRRAWLSLPREARAAIRRLHTMLGHAPNEVMLHILKGARADPQLSTGVKHFRCDACHETEDAKRAHPVAPPSAYVFNHEVLIDIFEIHE
jgi:hypothetical protein